MSDIQLPADALTLLCERTAMPWPLPRVTQWVTLDPDACRLLAHRLAVAMDAEEPCAAWVSREPSRQVRGGPREMHWFIETPGWVYDLPGVPSTVTDPAEALAWAVCWWAMVEALPGFAAEEGWREARAVALDAGLPLWTPLRDGVALEVSDAGASR